MLSDAVLCAVLDCLLIIWQVGYLLRKVIAVVGEILSVLISYLYINFAIDDMFV